MQHREWRVSPALSWLSLGSLYRLQKSIDRTREPLLVMILRTSGDDRRPATPNIAASLTRSLGYMRRCPEFGQSWRRQRVAASN